MTVLDELPQVESAQTVLTIAPFFSLFFFPTNF